jgi:hypothetical protein
MSQFDEQIRQYERDKAVIVGLLNEYVSEHACPCRWEQFEYWVSKEHGLGWHDEYQNILAESAVNLPCFDQNVIEPSYNIRVTCKHCGRKWHYTSDEWRMLAYRKRLVPDDQRVLNSKLLVGGWFATAGFEPNSATVLSLEQWYEYMSGNPCPTHADRSGSARGSLLSRVWGAICDRP